MAKIQFTVMLQRSAEWDVTEEQERVLSAGRDANPEEFDKLVAQLVAKGHGETNPESPLEWLQTDMWMEKDGGEEVELYSA